MNAKETAWLDQEDAWMRNTVRKNGWAITYVGNEGCTYPGCECGCEADAAETVFGYTVGLHGLGHPELLMYGCDPDTTSLVLNTLGRWIRDGGQPRWGVDHTVDGFAFALQFQAVPNSEEILYEAYRFYRPEEASGIPALHVYGRPVTGTHGKRTTRCRSMSSRCRANSRRMRRTVSAIGLRRLAKVIRFARDDNQFA